ncbi:MAG: hypothetical protein Q7R47_03490, partial [Candidatus Diapherotrites archaeon]|nr:hypothetical protein [Candidatus Diapherotrites archaeon]
RQTPRARVLAEVARRIQEIANREETPSDSMSAMSRAVYNELDDPRLKVSTVKTFLEQLIAQKLVFFSPSKASESKMGAGNPRAIAARRLRRKLNGLQRSNTMAAASRQSTHK